MLSLNQIQTLFQNKKANHAQLSNGTFFLGSPYDIGQDEEITYPLWSCWINNATINGNDFVTSFQFFFADLVHKDLSSQVDVLSDTQLMALDIYSQLKYDLENYYDATVNVSALLEEKVASLNDEVTGWELTFEIKQFYDQSVCSDISAGNAGKVIIVDSEGNVLEYLNPNTTYTVTQLTTLLQTLGTPPTTIIQDIV